MAAGIVLYFNDISGTGRIRGDDGSLIKVSQTSLLRDGYKILDEGQRVSYEAVRSKSGFEAVSVSTENFGGTGRNI